MRKAEKEFNRDETRLKMRKAERELKRGAAPLKRKSSPSPYQGEGDKGDRVTQ